MRDHQMTTASSKPMPSGKKKPTSLKPGVVSMKKHPSEDSARSKEATGEKKVLGNEKKHKKKAADSLKPSSVPQIIPSASKPRVVVPETSSTHNPPQSKESEGTLPSQTGNEHEKKDSRLKGKSDFNGRHVEQRGPSNRNENRKSSSKNEEDKRREDRKQKVGGIIFMCNTKTKPDCFHYRVMAVPSGKKDLIMGISPGLKLFLYDFDLKLLYGIYEASSTGGMMLEPNAFKGSFPAQVRFRILKDCQPLPERVFKKAILENSDERTHKFKTELTVEQVKKLSSLFCPDHLTSAEQPIVQQTVPIRKAPARPPPINAGPSEVLYDSKPLFLTEKEYRTYGLRPQIHGLQQSTELNVLPLESHQRVNEREHILKNLAPSHLVPTSIPNGRITSASERLFLSEQEYRLYGLRAHRDSASLIPPTTHEAIGITSNEDQYRPYSYTSTAVSTTDPYLQLLGRGTNPPDPYIFHPRREPYTSESLLLEHGNSYHLPVRASDEKLLHTGYSVQLYQNNPRSHPGSQAVSASAPVSSRYSFNGALYR